MPIFFLVGGYANAASWRSARVKAEPYGAWLRARLRRLVLPVLPLLAVWALAAFALFQAGLDPDLIRLGSQAALVPLWFLATYVLVVSLTPVTLWAWDRFGWGSLVVTAALAGLMDLVQMNTLELHPWGARVLAVVVASLSHRFQAPSALLFLGARVELHRHARARPWPAGAP